MTEPAPAPTSLGWASNSDEIAAIDEVEAAFGVTIDYADAPQWHTAGDVFRSLLAQLPAGQADEPEIWERFAGVLSQTSDVDPDAITPETPLADVAQAWRGLNALSAMLLLLLIGMALVVILGAVLLTR